MKILEIKGKNIASLEGDFKIDFSVEPLKSAGLFAITGPTGAGKSSILDTICLALFDDTPRTKKAENSIRIADVKTQDIGQADCRNLLRRGCAEAMAEVTFVAVNGDVYKATWSVARARQKVDGTLQASQIKAVNLTTSAEVQGTKKDILATISELIGLSFEQFTRAVLLAQGEFSAFLQAKADDKADILEKITGTAIYSQISKQIFEDWRHADDAAKLKELELNNTKLLTPEELQLLNEQKLEAQKLALSHKENLLVLSKQFEWLKMDEQLNLEVAKALSQVQLAENQIAVAQSRFNLIADIEKVQGVRDIYREALNLGRSLTEKTSNHKNKCAELEAIQIQIKTSDTNLKTSELDLKRVKEHLQTTQPQLILARELDVKIVNASAQLQRETTDFKQAKQGIEAHQLKIESLEKQQILKLQQLDGLQNWFIANQKYSPIIPIRELLTTLHASWIKQLQEGTKATQDFNHTSNLSVRTTALLTDNRQKLLAFEKMLPAEVVLLRAQLKDQTPCPVCGSLEHPVLQEPISNNKALLDAEITKNKNSLTEQIHLHEEQIKQYDSELIRLKTIEVSSIQLAATALEQLQKRLSEFNVSTQELQNGTFLAALNNLAQEWQQNEKLAQEATALVAQITTELKSDKETLKHLKTVFNDAQIRFNSAQTAINDLTVNRSKLLNGASANELENTLNNQIKNAEHQHKTVTETHQLLTNKKSQLTALTQALVAEIQQLTQAKQTSDVNVHTWIQTHYPELTTEHLHHLLQKEATWIATETAQLTAFKNAFLVHQTTLKERQNKLQTHAINGNRPTQDGITKLLVEQAIATVEEQLAINNQLFSSIVLKLEIDKSNRLQLATLTAELQKLVHTASRWAILKELFGQADGSKFKKIAQGYTLDALLLYANQHLTALSNRYQLQRIPDAVALMVLDSAMGNEHRSVHSLSGGESFLVSLALALSLSSLSSNRMQIESLFIDEGFGSLDAKTLNDAMDTLANLQTQGRKIGIISHVGEMIERIPVRIDVQNSSNGGRSTVRVIG